jgi:hypothetical protein
MQDLPALCSRDIAKVYHSGASVPVVFTAETLEIIARVLERLERQVPFMAEKSSKLPEPVVELMGWALKESSSTTGELTEGFTNLIQVVDKHCVRAPPILLLGFSYLESKKNFAEMLEHAVAVLFC